MEEKRLAHCQASATTAARTTEAGATTAASSAAHSPHPQATAVPRDHSHPRTTCH